MGVQSFRSCPYGGSLGTLGAFKLKSVERCVHNQIVTDEVLTTAMTESESLINSCPLTEVTSNLNDLEALTPNHFILGQVNANLHHDVLNDREISSPNPRRRFQIIATHIWNRWLRVSTQFDGAQKMESRRAQLTGWQLRFTS